MKKIKIVLMATCLVISVLGISNLATDNGIMPSLRQLALIRSAQAGNIEEITVYPDEGPTDGRDCTYWTHSITGEITYIYPIVIGGNVSFTWEQHYGTKTLCREENEEYCDYIGCH